MSKVEKPVIFQIALDYSLVKDRNIDNLNLLLRGCHEVNHTEPRRGNYIKPNNYIIIQGGKDILFTLTEEELQKGNIHPFWNGKTSTPYFMEVRIEDQQFEIKRMLQASTGKYYWKPWFGPGTEKKYFISLHPCDEKDERYQVLIGIRGYDPHAPKRENVPKEKREKNRQIKNKETNEKENEESETTEEESTRELVETKEVEEVKEEIKEEAQEVKR